MHAIGAALANRVQDGIGVEVTLCSGLATEGIGLVGKSHMQGIAIELGIYGNRRDSHFSGGADDSDGDFASIGYQDFFQHGLLSLPDEP